LARFTHSEIITYNKKYIITYKVCVINAIIESIYYKNMLFCKLNLVLLRQKKDGYREITAFKTNYELQIY